MIYRNSNLVRTVCTLIAALNASWSTSASAQVFENRVNGNTAVAVVNSVAVDLEVREELIRKARTIDVLSFLQTGGGEIGTRLTLAMRDAAANGAKVRVFYDLLFSAGENFPKPDEFAKVMMSSETTGAENAPELYRLGPTDKLRIGLLVDDFFHEKITILNRGTPDEVIIVTNKNNAGSTLDTIETTMLFRPVDPTQPYLGDDLKAYADQLLAFGKKNVKPIGRTGSVQAIVEKLRARVQPLPFDAEESAQREEVLEWATTPVSQTRERKYGFVFLPKEAQLVSNDLIAQVQQNFRYSSFRKRVNALQTEIVAKAGELRSDILASVSADIEKSGSAMISTYLMNFPTVMANAIKKAVHSGARLSIFTNGKSALKKIAGDQGPVAAPMGSVANRMAFETAQRLFDGTENAAGNLEMFGLDVAEAQSYSAMGDRDAKIFLHRKWARVGDKIYFGSENFTPGGSVQNNEIMTRLVDADLADYMSGRMSREGRYFKPITKEVVKETLERRGMKEHILDFFYRPLVRRIF